MKVYLDTIGCRLNQAEIELYARQLVSLGHQLVAQPGEADLAVVNTCMVTAAAESDSRQKIRQITRLGVDNVVATGCWVTMKPAEASALPGIGRLVPNQDKDRLVPAILDLPLEAFDVEPVERQPVPGSRLRTRAFIKVQDGCDNHCTFCITTLARGAGKSRPIHEILDDIHLAVGERRGSGNMNVVNNAGGGMNSSTREIVLTGVHLGSWGHDLSPRLHLFDLVRAILESSAVPRIRLSSLEPWDLDEAFFSLWQDTRLCRHLHLPLQSGCAATLKRMARKTTPVAFSRLVAQARAAIPGVAITTDLITGFPGETETEFKESLAFVEELRFADGHVFTYSERPGTAATRLPGKVPAKVRKTRSADLRSVLERSSRNFRRQFIGQVLPVLWETASPAETDSPPGKSEVGGFESLHMRSGDIERNGEDGQWSLTGLTDNYLRVQVTSAEPLWNTITPVRLVEESLVGLIGSFSDKSRLSTYGYIAGDEE